MSNDLDPVDEELRRQLMTAVGVLDVDVDAQWEQLADNCRAQRRRSLASRLAAAAVVLVVSLTAGQPLVVAGSEAVVRFISDAAATIVDNVADAIADRVPDLRDAGDTHVPIDENDDYWVAIRSVHQQLNNAIGYRRSELDELDGANDRLLEIAGDEPAFEEQVRSAAALIRLAQEGNDRDLARKAHRIIEDIERGLARR